MESMMKNNTGHARHLIIQNCIAGEIHRTKPWAEPEIPSRKIRAKYEPWSNADQGMQISGCFNKTSFEERTKTKTRGTPTPNTAIAHHVQVRQHKALPASERMTFAIDLRTHKFFKTIFYTTTSESGDLPKSIKWDEFKRAMTRLGFAVKNTHGSAWQFTPGDATGPDLSIQMPFLP
ncbi:hypothetical protein BDU57DRAFT_549174 [Ampelomyces quisqualis]|uniref:Uncharacterized protein n=1 Tax=Ampelomyces quisqualis TaxID=50730 RepID=A0A6A5QNC2_AMPQU|nr:hypothetical protein BDU57DRAFT_549174 [Ampelomyces quisqualis]